MIIYKLLNTKIRNGVGKMQFSHPILTFLLIYSSKINFVIRRFDAAREKIGEAEQSIPTHIRISNQSYNLDTGKSV